MCNPLTDPTCVVKSVVGGAANSIFDELAKWWTDAYSSMTGAFAKAFLRSGDVSISQFQSSGLWRLELGVGATIAAGLMIWAGARSAWTRSGDPLATGMLGGVKAVFATAMVFAVVTALLGVADQLTQAVVNSSAGDSNGFAERIGQLASVSNVGGGSGALVFLFSLIGVLVTAVLWIEMLIRAAGVVIVTLSTPVGAAGLVSERTAGWWRRMVSAELALIFVKPVVALVLAVGFTVSHEATGIQGVLVGFMVLGAAAVAWPVVGRMFTFFEGQFAIGGMAAAFGMAEAARARIGSVRSSGSQPMWQSMEDAASRPGGGGGVDGGGGGLGSGAGVAQVMVRGAGGQASGGELGGAAADAGTSAAAGGAALAAAAVRLAARGAVEAPGRVAGRAADLAGLRPPAEPLSGEGA